MPTDIVFPENNEEEFVKLAEELGYDELLFLYKGEIPQRSINSKIKIRTGVIALPKDIEKAKRKAGIVVVKSSYEQDRWVLEHSKADILFGLEESQRKDYMHHRGSGLNQVLCKIAADRGKTLGFSFSSVLNAESWMRARIIGRMMQNARFCRKYKVNTVLASFAKSPYEMRHAKDMAAFKRLIGL